MLRRSFLTSMTATGAAMLTPQLGFACGGHVGAAIEEFIDLVDTTGNRKQLATHAVDSKYPAASRSRFAVSADGGHLAYAHLQDGTFHLIDRAGKTRLFKAPEGAEPMFNPTNPNTLVLLIRKVGRKQVRVVNLTTYEDKIWDEFIDVRSVTFTPIGLIVAHDRPNQGGGALSLLKEPGKSQELRRLNFVHTLTQSRGAQLGYFAAAEAYAMDLQSLTSKSFGTVPYELRGAAWLGEGLLGISEEGAYWMREGTAYRRHLSDRELFTAFNHGKYTITASPQALYVFSQDGRLLWHHPGEGKLHDVRWLPGGNELCLSQGGSVYLANIGARSTQLIATSRKGLRLAGALPFGERVVIWSTKHWHKTQEGKCVPEALPTPFKD